MDNNDFKIYRLKRDYSAKTIKSQDCYVRRFTAWLTTNEISLQSINYQTVLNYISEQRKNNINPQNLKNQLQAIRIYFDYQTEKGTIQTNPAGHIRLQDKAYKVPYPSVDEETLSNIYKTFANKQCRITRGTSEHQRDTVVLGLMVFQGLDSGDLERLTIKDINLTEGTLYIASSRRNAARTLKLESPQILSIHQYITDQTPTDKLFAESKINDMVSAIVQKLKEQYPEIQTPRHIRSSVIMNWLKKHHIRQVQYMAGHRRVGSTERYRREDLHDLSQQILKFHPIR